MLALVRLAGSKTTRLRLTGFVLTWLRLAGSKITVMREVGWVCVVLTWMKLIEVGRGWRNLKSTQLRSAELVLHLAKVGGAYNSLG